ncbi:MAG: hypothetical protein HY720_10385 [Planctomycetes bacterium]|nr:hypothetical protein [Planctomycetota bacterium]
MTPELDVERYLDGVGDGPVSVWSNWNVRETLPDVLGPFTWSIWRDVILPFVAQDVFGIPRSSPVFRHVVAIDLVEGRLYWNMNAMLAIPIFGPVLGRVLSVIDARAAEATERLIASGILVPRRLPGSRLALALGVVGAGARAGARMLGVLSPRRCMRLLDRCAVDVAARPAVSGLSDRDLLGTIRLFDSPEGKRVRRGIQMMSVGMAVYFLAERAFRPHPEARELLAVGVANNPTTAISIALDELAEAGRPLAPVFSEERSTGALFERLAGEPGGTEWLSHLDSFLARFGHRCPKEFDIAAPRWSEDPTMILDLVRARLSLPRSETTGERLARLRERRGRAIDAACKAERPWRRPVLRALARLVAEYMPLREAPKHAVMFLFARMRQAVAEIGRRLAARGILREASDVFWLRWPEARLLLLGANPPADLEARLARRREIHERRLRARPTEFVRSDGVAVAFEDPASEEPEQPMLLRGTGIFAGTASGPARILHSPDPSAVSQGDVIVMEFADPGWTPLFPRAAAVVMEVGGLMCHAAIVARELGIPSVFGVRDATRRLSDGERVTVDGAKGTVTRG